MPRVYLPLLPLPVLAAVAAFSACSRAPSDEPSARIIPAAVALAPAPAPAPGLAAAPGPAPTPAGVPPSGDDAPSEEELRAFHAPVAK